MINHSYRLVSSRQMEISLINEHIGKDDIIVRPTYLSICVADQRYFTGKRNKKIMEKKLPMALIHEGVGKVIYDPKGEFEIGDRVVMIPNTPMESDPVIHENYLETTKFRSSGYDGYTQDYIFLRRDRAVKLPDSLEESVAAYTELFSVAMHAVLRMAVKKNANEAIYGVWGDGNLGFLTSLILKYMYPSSKVIVFGVHRWKLDYFSFVDGAYLTNEVPEGIELDNIFECVGGRGSQSAIGQAIQMIKPEGTISLLGVSEYPVELETRMVLEKGLTLFGSSRSGRVDFEKSLEFIQRNEPVQGYLKTLIGKVITIDSVSNIIAAFEFDLSNDWGKTIMKWKI